MTTATTSSEDRRFARSLALGLAVIALLGVIVAVQPFTGDQALFASGARQLAHGDVLYRDVWDVKQPGIYAFYVLGGAIAGYGEVALHLVELATLLGFVTYLALALRTRYRRSWIAAAVPVLTAGTYYATIEPVQLGQVESLIGIPLTIALVSASRAPESRELGSRRIQLLIAGVAGGTALMFKLIFAPIVGAIWLTAAIPIAREQRLGRVRRGLAASGWIALGAALPLGLVFGYLMAHGQLENAGWTFFDVPRTATAIAGRPLPRLIDGGITTGARWAVPLALAIFGVAVRWRRGWDRFDTGLATWVALGVPVFLVQHWWIYQYAMFLVPIGCFAAYGLDELADVVPRMRRARRNALVAVAVLAALPMGARITRNAHDLTAHDFAVTAADRAALHAEREPNYRKARRWSDHLRRVGDTPNGIYVVGNPLNVYLADRPQTVAINGWSPEQYSSEVWRRLRAQLAAARPTEIVVDRFSVAIMRNRSPATLRLIHRLYVRVGASGADTWYRLRSAGS